VEHRILVEILKVGAVSGKNSGGKRNQVGQGELSSAYKTRIAEVRFRVVAVVQSSFEEIAPLTVRGVVDEGTDRGRYASDVDPAGSKIAYYFGGWRLADWAINLDDAVVGVNRDGNRTSEPAVIVSGYHEDFPPAWSPDGKWIAFHSHRSPRRAPII